MNIETYQVTITKTIEVELDIDRYTEDVLNEWKTHYKYSTSSLDRQGLINYIAMYIAQDFDENGYIQQFANMPTKRAQSCRDVSSKVIADRIVSTT